MSISLTLDKIFSSGSASSSNRWNFANFLDKVIFANGSVRSQYWPGFGNCYDLPCLDKSSRYDGVISFQGHLMLYQGSTIRWSDVNDFSNFIPVPTTITNIVLTLSDTFIQLDSGITSGWVYVNESTSGMVKDMFVRIDLPPYYNFYTIEDVAPNNGVSAVSSNFTQFIAAGATSPIFTVDQSSWAANGFVTFSSNGKPLLIISQSSPTQLYGTIGTGFTAPAINASIQITMTSNVGWLAGDYISLGSQQGTGLDIYLIASIDVTNFKVTCTRLGIGSSQKSAYSAGDGAITQPYVMVQNNNTLASAALGGTSVIEKYAIKISLENLTGSAPTGTSISSGTQILSLNANEAGELVNAGDRVNGPIWAMSTIGLYAVIMKERSFQSIQYVGTPSIFFIWPEFTDEGLLGRNTWCKVGESTIYFWGHRAFFRYMNGEPQEVGQKHFLQVLNEIDLGKAQEAFMYHKEDRHEVWFVYPVQGQGLTPRRVFIYNYEQNSISIDDYTESQGIITAVGALDYTTALSWEDWEGHWNQQILSWSDLTEGKQRLTLIANYPDAAAHLYAHGLVYTRNGEAYQSLFETVAHDCGDEQSFKYLDLLQFSLQIKEKLNPRPFRLFSQIGVQENFDGDIVWCTPQWVDCAGNANYVTKLNFSVAGRFLTIRFYSDQADTQWRVTSYSISGRIGGTY